MTDSQPWPPPGRRGAGGPGAGEPGSAGRAGGRAEGRGSGDLGTLLGQVARGDDAAYSVVYARVVTQAIAVPRSAS